MYWFQRWFEKMTEAIRSESHVIQEAIQEQERAIRDRNKTSEEQQREVGVTVARAIETAANTIPNYKYTKNDKEYSLQRKMLWVTAFGAVSAAAAAAGAIYYAGIAKSQLVKMDDTYREMHRQTIEARKSAYASCLNAEAAQRAFILLQSTARDSHDAAAATVQQAEGQLESERAELRISIRSPEDGEYLVRNPSIPTSVDQLGMPFSIRNDGKSAAQYILRIKATFLGRGDKLSFIEPNEVAMRGTLLPNQEFPGSADPGSRYRPPTTMAPVEDTNGLPVPINSVAFRQFFTANADISVYGTIEYSDTWSIWTLGAYIEKGSA